MSSGDTRLDDGTGIGRAGRPRSAPRREGGRASEGTGSEAASRRREPAATEPELLSGSDVMVEPDLLFEPELLVDEGDAAAPPETDGPPTPRVKPVVPRMPDASAEPSTPVRPRRKLEFPDEF